MAESLKYTCHQYGSINELQRLGVWELDPVNINKYWIIYIHGGCWRDPRIDHKTFANSINCILAHPSPTSAQSSIAGFASLDYRLSPHPDFPQDLSTTPESQLRNATHPAHVNDVYSGLAFLQRRYGFGSRYVLVGHSAGACLALQLLGGLAGIDNGLEVVLPEVVVPFEGIYDFSGLNNRKGGTYAEYFSGAFGDDPLGWDAVAPLNVPESFRGRWADGKLVLLGWSKDDELIDEPEVDAMAARLQRDGVRVVVWKDLSGRHDEIWEQGEQVAKMVLWALDDVVRGT
ncbi:Kynurenine formamidase [Daldinia childiae]|uniref:Kynurenine formamidase n=1 Tax=Daldinia childiae TaxID=326645 RepID=UPI001446094E|nr:Kynurenine formamidase [Daldinia childiae]KAF3061325.1 Kynurenine formamidase [Daldinia childiae]